MPRSYGSLRSQLTCPLLQGAFPDLSSWAAAGTLPGLPQQGSDLSVCNCPIPTLATLGWSPGWTVNPVKAGPGYLGHTVSPAPSSLGLGTRPVLIDCLLTLDKGLLPLSLLVLCPCSSSLLESSSLTFYLASSSSTLQFDPRSCVLSLPSVVNLDLTVSPVPSKGPATKGL